MTGTPEQAFRICALHEARLALDVELARQAQRHVAMTRTMAAALQFCTVMLVVGLAVI